MRRHFLTLKGMGWRIGAQRRTEAPSGSAQMPFDPGHRAFLPCSLRLSVSTGTLNRESRSHQPQYWSVNTDRCPSVSSSKKTSQWTLRPRTPLSVGPGSCLLKKKKWSGVKRDLPRMWRWEERILLLLFDRCSHR